MMLRRIEAERFGQIDGCSLGDLGPGLTVVLGPNEAGKSSFTALVRYVLYGFPTPADAKEAPFLSDAGKRRGRLVFEEGSGRWVVDRAEGPHGGPVTVRSLAGTERPDLVGELTRGVSKAAYRVVFGFGLAEMAQLDQLKGKDDDVWSRLYAASAGLRVSPPDLRARLDEQADTLWKKGGSAPPVNRRKSERDEARKEIRRLEGEADALRAERERLGELETRLGEAKTRRADTQAVAEARARAADEVERLLLEAGSLESVARDRRRLIEQVHGKRVSIAADDEALTVADDVDALTRELPAFRQRLDALSTLEGRLAIAERKIAGLLADAGLGRDDALTAASDAGTSAEIEAARAELQELRVRADMTRDAVDRLRAEAAGGVETGRGARQWLVPGVALAALGAVGIVAGVLSRQLPLAAFAAATAVLGIVFATLSRLLPGAGSGRGASGPPTARQRAAEETAAVAARALEARLTTWAGWVVAHRLGDGSEPPAAIAARWQLVREVRGAESEREALARDAGVERDAVAAFTDRVRSLACPLTTDDAASLSPADAPEALARAAVRIARARETLAEIQELTEQESSITAGLAATDEDAAKVRETAAERLAAAGLPDGSIEDLRLAESGARTEAEEAREAYDELNRQTAELVARVGEAERATSLAERRMDEATLTEQIAADVRRYVVLKLATRLLGTAQERYERDRQPEVVKRAQAAFSHMTQGRYTRLTIPLGREAIEVFDASSAAKLPDRLSRGTAEQLYLALRIGLIDQLGDAGSGLPVLMDDVLVNFSPNRVRAAAETLAELAVRRQVVFFTCHPSMAELLGAVAPGAARIEVPGPPC